MNLERVLNHSIFPLNIYRKVEEVAKSNEDPEVPKKEVKHPVKGKFFDELVLYKYLHG